MSRGSYDGCDQVSRLRSESPGLEEDIGHEHSLNETRAVDSETLLNFEQVKEQS